MAKVKSFVVERGQMFGGRGVAVWRPSQNKQSPSETDGSTPEALLASEVEQAILRLSAQNLPHNGGQE